MDVGSLITMLERDDSLELNSEEKTYTEEQEPISVDYERLFPPKMGQDGNDDWDLYGDQWDVQDEELENDIIKAAMAGVYSGEDIFRGESPDWPSDITRTGSGIWDTCAWYQPIHFFGYDWGIFIREDCLKTNAIRIASYLQLDRPPKNRSLLAKAVLRASFITFFLHEHYHHKVESLGFRMHVIQGTSAYLPYKRKIYRKTLKTDDCIEEGLANASAYRRLASSPYNNFVGDSVRRAAREYLKWSFRYDPPGYRLASNLLGAGFTQTENLLKGQVKESQLKPKQSRDDWENSPDIMRPFFRVDQNIYTVVSKGKRSILPTTTDPKSCSTQAMTKIYEGRGYKAVPGGKGSHVKLKKPGSKTMILPGNRKDLSCGVIKEALKAIGSKPSALPELLAAI